MLIEFSVTNFRSIKEKQTLSMVAPSSVIKKDGRCIIETGFKAAPYLVEIASIYGPNGSGKSNLMRALGFLRGFVLNSSKNMQKDEAINVTPFLLSEMSRTAPSVFEISFIHQNYLFEYGFSADQAKVHDEWLYATPSGKEKQKPQTWFKRAPDDVENSTISDEVKGEKSVWKNVTRDNALFLSTAVQFNAEAFAIPFEWIQKKLRVFTDPSGISPSITARHVVQNGKKEQVLKLMHGLDLSFFDFKVKEEEFEFAKMMGADKVFSEEMLTRFLNNSAKAYEITTIHRTEEGGTYEFEFEQESLGTKRLFSLAGPMIEVLESGMTLFVDEINSSLHPLALQGLVDLFRCENNNRNNAQLIITTHDTSLMAHLDRDQIWLMDKGEFGASTLTPLTDFKNKAGVPIEKRYLGGRYGGLPNIGNLISW